MYNRLHEFVKKNEILFKKHFGFQAASPTKHVNLCKPGGTGRPPISFSFAASTNLGIIPKRSDV